MQLPIRLSSLAILHSKIKDTEVLALLVQLIYPSHHMNSTVAYKFIHILWYSIHSLQLCYGGSMSSIHALLCRFPVPSQHATADLDPPVPVTAKRPLDRGAIVEGENSLSEGEVEGGDNL